MYIQFIYYLLGFPGMQAVPMLGVCKNVLSISLANMEGLSMLEM